MIWLRYGEYMPPMVKILLKGRFSNKKLINLRRGEGGGAGTGKKDTGYLYKAFMVARHGSPADVDSFIHGQQTPTTESWACVLG